MKFAFNYIRLQLCISKSKKNFLDMSLVFELVVIIDKNVVQIDRIKIVKIFSKRVINVMLKRDRFIIEIEC
jgi:hypothetical protein